MGCNAATLPTPKYMCYTQYLGAVEFRKGSTVGCISPFGRRRRRAFTAFRRAIPSAQAHIMAPHEVILATAEKFQVLARGAGGIEELSSELPEDDASVVWGLVTCIIGSGTFARTKYIKVNLSGAKCAHAHTHAYAHAHARTHARVRAR